MMAGGQEAARSYKRGRSTMKRGCTEVIWGLNIPAGVKDTGPTVDFGKKSHVVQSDIEIQHLCLCVTETRLDLAVSSAGVIFLL